MKNMLTSKIKKIFSKYSKAVGVSVLLVSQLLVAGCCLLDPDLPVVQPSPSQLAYNKFVSTESSQGKEICSQGGHILKVGETVRIILPEYLLFNPSSANLIHSNMSILNAVSSYIRAYQLKNVKVEAYSDHPGSVKLTSLQARTVASYLWSEGINTRLLHSQGYGDRNKVASNATTAGLVDNRRVEIKFRFYPKYISYN